MKRKRKEEESANVSFHEICFWVLEAKDRFQRLPNSLSSKRALLSKIEKTLEEWGGELLYVDPFSILFLAVFHGKFKEERALSALLAAGETVESTGFTRDLLALYEAKGYLRSCETAILEVPSPRGKRVLLFPPSPGETISSLNRLSFGEWGINELAYEKLKEKLGNRFKASLKSGVYVVGEFSPEEVVIPETKEELVSQPLPLRFTRREEGQKMAWLGIITSTVWNVLYEVLKNADSKEVRESVLGEFSSLFKLEEKFEISLLPQWFNRRGTSIVFVGGVPFSFEDEPFRLSSLLAEAKRVSGKTPLRESLRKKSHLLMKVPGEIREELSRARCFFTGYGVDVEYWCDPPMWCVGGEKLSYVAGANSVGENELVVNGLLKERLRSAGKFELITEVPPYGELGKLYRLEHFEPSAARRWVSDFPLVGRQSELNSIIREAKRCENGEFRKVLLLGEAGVGKTRLAKEALKKLEGWLKVEVFANSYEVQRKHLYFKKLVKSFVRALGDGDENHGWEIAKEVAGPFGGGRVEILRTFVNSSTAPREVEKRAVRIFTALTVKVSRKRPIVVLLDDLHWSDPESLELVNFFFSMGTQSRRLVLATSRNKPKELFFSLVLRLNALPESAVREMIRKAVNGEPSDKLVKEVFEKSAGNPLFVEQLLIALKQKKCLREENGTVYSARVEELPSTLSELLLQNVDSLSADVREILKKCSVFGETFPASALSEEEKDALKESGLANLEGEFGKFSHPLYREAIYQSLLPETRKELHRRAGMYYERMEDFEKASTHYLSGEDYSSFLRVLNSHALRLHRKGNAEEALNWVERARKEREKCWKYEEFVETLELGAKISLPWRASTFYSFANEGLTLCKNLHPDRTWKFYMLYGEFYRERNEPEEIKFYSQKLSEVGRECEHALLLGYYHLQKGDVERGKFHGHYALESADSSEARAEALLLLASCEATERKPPHELTEQAVSVCENPENKLRAKFVNSTYDNDLRGLEECLVEAEKRRYLTLAIKACTNLLGLGANAELGEKLLPLCEEVEAPNLTGALVLKLGEKYAENFKWEALIQLSPPHIPEDIVSRLKLLKAEAYLNLGDNFNAKKELRELRNEPPEKSALMGLIALQEGETGTAVTHLSRAVSRPLPHHIKVQSILGLIKALVLSGERETAKRTLEHHLKELNEEEKRVGERIIGLNEENLQSQ